MPREDRAVLLEQGGRSPLWRRILRLGFGLIPFFFAFTFVLALSLTYIQAVYFGHVEAFMPYISEAADQRPESSLFTVLIILSSIFAIATVILRMILVTSLLNGMWPRVKTLNIVACIVGLISAFCMLLIGSYQETSVIQVHLTSAFTLFFCGCAYMALQTFISYALAPMMSSTRMARFRLVLTLFAFVCLLVVVIFGTVAAHVFHAWFPDLPTPRPWKDTTVPGFAFHVVSAIAEWMMAFVFMVFIVSFSREFETLQATLTISSLVRSLDEDPLWRVPDYPEYEHFQVAENHTNVQRVRYPFEEQSRYFYLSGPHSLHLHPDGYIEPQLPGILDAVDQVEVTTEVVNEVETESIVRPRPRPQEQVQELPAIPEVPKGPAIHPTRTEEEKKELVPPPQDPVANAYKELFQSSVAILEDDGICLETDSQPGTSEETEEYRLVRENAVAKLGAEPELAPEVIEAPSPEPSKIPSKRNWKDPNTYLRWTREEIEELMEATDEEKRAVHFGIAKKRTGYEDRGDRRKGESAAASAWRQKLARMIRTQLRVTTQARAELEEVNELEGEARTKALAQLAFWKWIPYPIGRDRVKLNPKDYFDDNYYMHVLFVTDFDEVSKRCDFDPAKYAPNVLWLEQLLTQRRGNFTTAWEFSMRCLHLYRFVRDRAVVVRLTSWCTALLPIPELNEDTDDSFFFTEAESLPQSSDYGGSEDNDEE